MSAGPRAAIILSAGQGKRMRSDLAKVLHKISGRTLIECSLDTLRNLGLSKIVIIVGHQGQAVIDHLQKNCADLPLEFCWQKELKGTGHATAQAEDVMKDFNGSVLVTFGDVPMLTERTLTRLFEMHENSPAALTCLTANVSIPFGYGRIIRDSNTDRLLRIVEEKDASDEERKIAEINVGPLCADAGGLFRSLNKTSDDNAQKEYYLTDIVAILNAERRICQVCLADNEFEIQGVNSIEQLEAIERELAGGS